MVFDQPPASQDPGDSRISPATHRQQRKPSKSSASRAGRKRLSKTTLIFMGAWIGNLCPGLQSLSEHRGETPPKIRWCHCFICATASMGCWRIQPGEGAGLKPSKLKLPSHFPLTADVPATNRNRRTEIPTGILL